MTEGERPDVDRLAALESGLLDADEAAQVLAAAQADPRSAEVLAALAATRAELAALRTRPVPPEVARRWDAALEAVAEAGLPTGGRLPDSTSAGPLFADGHPAVAGGDAPASANHRAGGSRQDPGATDRHPVGWRPSREPTAERATPRSTPPGHAAGGRRPGTARPPGKGASDPAARRFQGGPRPTGRPLRPRPALVVAALLVLVVAVGALWSRPPGRVELAAAGRAALGVMDVGPLADPLRRAGCLRAVLPAGSAPDAPLLGGRPIEVDGRDAVLLVVGTGELGVFRIVAVDPGCGPGGGTLLGTEVAGR